MPMRFEEGPGELDTKNRLRRTVAQSARLPAALTVEMAVIAVMCVLTERLTAGEAHDVLVDVPPAIRPMFELCVLHREGKSTAKLSRAEFVASVSEHLGVTPAHAELVCSAVFTAVRAELPRKTVDAVASQLPRGLKELWLGPPIAAPDLDVEIPPEDTRLAIELDLERRAHLPAHVTPASAFAAVMCAFTRRLSGGETKHVLLGLPPAVRPLLELCTAHRAEHSEVFDRGALVRMVGEHLATEDEDTERVVAEVLRAAKRALPQQTIAEVDSQLPADLLELWRSALPLHDEE